MATAIDYMLATQAKVAQNDLLRSQAEFYPQQAQRGLTSQDLANQRAQMQNQFYPQQAQLGIEGQQLQNTGLGYQNRRAEIQNDWYEKNPIFALANSLPPGYAGQVMLGQALGNDTQAGRQINTKNQLDIDSQKSNIDYRNFNAGSSGYRHMTAPQKEMFGLEATNLGYSLSEFAKMAPTPEGFSLIANRVPAWQARQDYPDMFATGPARQQSVGAVPVPQGQPQQQIADPRLNNPQGQQATLPQALSDAGQVPAQGQAPQQAPRQLSPNDDIAKEQAGQIKAGILNKVYSEDQQKRIQAGQRFRIAKHEMDKYFPDFASYLGSKGQSDLKADQASALLGGKVSPRYQGYMNFENQLSMAKGDAAVLLGKRATDSAMKEIDDIFDVGKWATNPQAAKKRYDSYMDTLLKTEEANLKTLPEVIADAKAEFAKNPTQGQGGSDERVHVINPQGQGGMILKSQLADAEKAGWKVG